MTGLLEADVAIDRPTQERLAALGAELGVGTFPTYDEGRHLIEMAGWHAESLSEHARLFGEHAAAEVLSVL
jgi:hypothetical protein